MVKATDRPDNICEHRLGRRTRWRGALLGTLIAIGLAGCVPIPIDHVEGRELDPNAVTPIKIGVTTRQEVLAQLGEPNAIWEEERVLAYSWDRTNWVVIFLIGGEGAAQFVPFAIPSTYMVLIQLDETDRVKRAEWVEQPVSVSYGQFLREWAHGKGDNKP